MIRLLNGIHGKTNRVYRLLTGWLFLSALLLPCTAVAEEESLILGLHPFLSSVELFKRFSPLAEYLTFALRRPVQIKIAPSYAAHIDEVAGNKLDIAYLGPAPYIRVVDSFGPRPLLARLEMHGKTTFQGVIIVRHDSEIKSLADLVGKRFAFGDPASTMSHLVPRFQLIQAGITADRLEDFEFTNNHVNVALSVLLGMFDAGAVKETIFEQYQARGLKILARTPAITNHVFVARTDMSQKTIKELRYAFLHLQNTPFGPTILRAIKPSVTGLVPAQDEEFDGLRRIIKILSQQGIIP